MSPELINVILTGAGLLVGFLSKWLHSRMSAPPAPTPGPAPAPFPLPDPASKHPLIDFIKAIVLQFVKDAAEGGAKTPEAKLGELLKK